MTNAEEKPIEECSIEEMENELYERKLSGELKDLINELRTFNSINKILQFKEIDIPKFWKKDHVRTYRKIFIIEIVRNIEGEIMNLIYKDITRQIAKLLCIDNTKYGLCTHFSNNEIVTCLCNKIKCNLLKYCLIP